MECQIMGHKLFILCGQEHDSVFPYGRRPLTGGYKRFVWTMTCVSCWGGGSPLPEVTNVVFMCGPWLSVPCCSLQNVVLVCVQDHDSMRPVTQLQVTEVFKVLWATFSKHRAFGGRSWKIDFFHILHIKGVLAKLETWCGLFSPEALYFRKKQTRKSILGFGGSISQEINLENQYYKLASRW